MSTTQLLVSTDPKTQADIAALLILDVTFEACLPEHLRFAQFLAQGQIARGAVQARAEAKKQAEQPIRRASWLVAALAQA